MKKKTSTKIRVERVDGIPVIYGMLERMGIREIVDGEITPHGNWKGMSPGWVITLWLVHILSEENHRMEPVQEWVGKHRRILRKLSRQKIDELDFADDRLAHCLREISSSAVWEEIESRLGRHLIRVYDLNVGYIRIDATVGSVNHNPSTLRQAQDGASTGQRPGIPSLFQMGKAKDGQYARQFKLMIASLDPLGLPLVADVEAGNRADDPLYIPSYQRVKEIVQRSGLLIVGDSKMSALATRGVIVAGGDAYITPLKEEPELLASLLDEWLKEGAKSTPIFLPAQLPSDGSAPDPKQSIAHGFEVMRPQAALVKDEMLTWSERLLIVCSYSYQKSELAGLQRRLDKAEAALRDLTPPRQKGKQQIQEKAGLLLRIEQIEKRYAVQGFFAYDYQCKIEERSVRGYKGNPPRLERKVRFQLSLTRNQEAIDKAASQMGWRIYATNATTTRLPLSQAVLAYRGQIVAENIFRRLHGKVLSITPLYVQREDHAQGLIHLLTLAARTLALGDYVAAQALAREKTTLAGVYAGNPNRSTPRPTMERMVRAFEGINLIITSDEAHEEDDTLPDEAQVTTILTDLSPVQERILHLLGLHRSLFSCLASA